MSPCAIHQSCVATLEDSWTGSVSAQSVDIKRTVVCPKPRRLSVVCTINDPSSARPFKWLLSHQQEDCDPKAANELLDIILSKDDTRDTDHFFPDISSFSPPRRVSNPLIQDARFVNKDFTPVVSPQTYGNNPAVRIEGFDCLDRDNRRNCSIPALA